MKCNKLVDAGRRQFLRGGVMATAGAVAATVMTPEQAKAQSLARVDYPAIRHAAQTNDVVISSGGVSAGEEDHILDAFYLESAELDVLNVAFRPGKPLTVGRLGKSLYFGLPGNPYGAATTFSQIAKPARRRAAGLMEEPDTWLPAVAGLPTVARSGGGNMCRSHGPAAMRSGVRS